MIDEEREKALSELRQKINNCSAVESLKDHPGYIVLVNDIKAGIKYIDSQWHIMGKNLDSLRINKLALTKLLNLISEYTAIKDESKRQLESLLDKSQAKELENYGV